MVRVEDVHEHRDRDAAAGTDVGEVAELPFGERQYAAMDLVGRAWVFTQSISDVAPEEWGARTG